MNPSEDSSFQPVSRPGATPPFVPPALPVCGDRDASSDRRPIEDPLFSGVLMRPPLEELDAVVDNRLRGLEVCDGPDQVQRLKRAHEIARRFLEEAMQSGDGVIGAARARQSSGTGASEGGASEGGASEGGASGGGVSEGGDPDRLSSPGAGEDD